MGTKTTPQSAAGAAKARKGSEKTSEDDPDGSSVLVISGPGDIPWARETMVALDEARGVASYGMKLLDHKDAAQRPPQ